MAFSDWIKKYFPAKESNVSDFLKEINNSHFQSDKLMLAFDKSKQENAKLRFNGFVCEKKSGKEIVVKSNDNKPIGKIVDGRFLPVLGVPKAGYGKPIEGCCRVWAGHWQLFYLWKIS